MLAGVKAIEQPGLVWGAHKFVAVGFGIKKLQITIVIEDELVSTDELQEKIQTDLEDYVQSTDIAAMQSECIYRHNGRSAHKFLFRTLSVRRVF